MKRLVDETADEFTRSLLVAGIEHQPDPGNKARVIVALGAGGALGLFSSNAFAWLGTTAGKVTAVSLAIGVAGAAFIAAPELLRQEPAPRAAVSSRGGAPRRPAPPAPAVGAAGAVEALAADEGSVAAPSSPLTTDSGSLPSGSPASATGKAATKKLSAWRERRLAARRRAALSQHVEARPDEPAAEAASAVPTAAAPLAERLDPIGVGLTRTKADLDSEVRLVDDMHWAARRNDREALGRFLERYREAFPDGQLKDEVAGFAARLEQSDTAQSP
jgi:hypothetical protein